MRILRFCLPILIATLAMQGIVKAEEHVGAAALKEVLIGNTLIGTTSRGGPYWLYRNANGEQAIETDSGFTDEGTWRITDDGELCSTWEKIRGGKELCLKFYRIGENRFKYTDADGVEKVFKVVKGNPENL